MDESWRIAELEAEVKRLRHAIIRSTHEIEQTLGKALGYPEYDETVCSDGNPNGDVCVGCEVPETLALQAAERIASLTAEVERFRAIIRSREETALDSIILMSLMDEDSSVEWRE
jgi:hypothetical protein